MSQQNNLHGHVESYKAASAINAYAAVQLDTTAFQVLPASGASNGVAPAYGLAMATAASFTNVPVQVGGWGKAIAAASLGVGCFVGAGIGTTSLVPIAASGVASALGAVQYPKYVLGVALEAAAAGAIFTVAIRPQVGV